MQKDWVVSIYVSIPSLRAELAFVIDDSEPAHVLNLRLALDVGQQWVSP